MPATDHLLAKYVEEIEDRQHFIDGLVQAASEKGQDLSEDQLELVTRARDRIQALNHQMAPLEEARRISADSSARVAEIVKRLEVTERPKEVQYRSAGAYILDRWQAGLGHEGAAQRVEMYHRAAAHQTTADNPGLLPEQIMGPVVNFVDETRPLVTALGPRNLPSGSWSRPRVTQHTTVGQQSAEKAELASQKMVIGKVPVTALTYGGYVNVSRQDADWTQPAIMDIIVSDLAGQYAITTENKVADDIVAQGTAGPTIPTGTPTPEDVAGAFWTAAGSVFTAVQGAGRLISVTGPDMLGMLGPIFPPINPGNAQSPGFSAAGFSTGAVGSIAGIPVYVTAGMQAARIAVLSTAAVEVYEDRIGALQIAEPSVLGVQVAYAGYFTDLIMEATGIQVITKTP